MALVLEIPPAIEAQLREAAAREGRAVSDYVLEAATERMLTLEEVDAENGAYSGHAADVIELGLLDYRTVRGQKFVSSRDLQRYQRDLKTEPESALAEMSGLAQLHGLADS